MKSKPRKAVNQLKLAERILLTRVLIDPEAKLSMWLRRAILAYRQAASEVKA